MFNFTSPIYLFAYNYHHLFFIYKLHLNGCQRKLSTATTTDTIGVAFKKNFLHILYIITFIKAEWETLSSNSEAVIKDSRSSPLFLAIILINNHLQMNKRITNLVDMGIIRLDRLIRNNSYKKYEIELYSNRSVFST